VEEYKILFIVYFIGLSFIFFSSLATYYIFIKYPKNASINTGNYIFFSSLLFYIVSILYLSFGKIDALHHYVDFATHLEILWRFSNGFGLTTLMSEDYHNGSHWFAAHFTPIIYLTYAPIFKIFPYTQTITIAETIFILSSLIPLWLISRKYLDDNLTKIFISSFLFYPTIFYTNLYGIAYIELCIPLFLWLFYFFEEKKFLAFTFVLFLILMTREEVSLVIIFFGFWILLKKKYLLGFFTSSIGLAYFYFAFFIAIPHFNNGNPHMATSLFDNYGNSLTEIIIYIFYNPLNILKEVFILPKIGNFVMIFAPILFIPFLNLSTAMIALPNLAVTFLSGSITHSSYILYYISPTIPILFYSIISSLNLKRKIYVLKKGALIYALFIATLTSTVFFGATPISLAYWFKDYKVGKFYTTNFHRSAYVEEDKDRIAKKIVELIPKNAVVSAEQHFTPLLYKHKKMIVFPSPQSEIEYVLIDRYNPKKTGGYYKNTLRTNPEAEYQKYIQNKNWLIIKEQLGIILFKKVN